MQWVQINFNGEIINVTVAPINWSSLKRPEEWIYWPFNKTDLSKVYDRETGEWNDTTS